MAKMKQFSVSGARPLPVVVLADISGSMSVDSKIQALNFAISEMINSFSEEDDVRAEIQVAVITFGNSEAKLHLALTPASNAEWKNMQARGNTPLGAALTMVRKMLEDKEKIPSRAYTPTLVLLSDGLPNDEWESPLQELLNSSRASKPMRLAMGIGADADFAMLERFIADPEIKVFRADEARQIRKFFQWVTLSVTSRSRSSNPNSAPIPPMEDTEDF